MLDCTHNASARQLTCRFSGDLNSATCADLAKELDARLRAISGGVRLPESFKIVFDLEKVNFLSSVFIRIVLTTAKKVKQGNFGMVKANPFVKELVRTSGLEQLLQDSSSNIECTMHETRVFPVPPGFAAAARVKSPDAYHAMYRASVDNPDAFWAEQAQQHLVWNKPWTTVCEWNLPNAKWFSGGQLNASVNCLDKHLDTPLADKIALIWEGEPYAPERPGEERVLTYRQLHGEVCRFANVLKRNGLGKGDRAIIYMPMIPEAVVAMLACARIGAIHSVVFGGFSAQSVADRTRDCGAKVVITADAGFRRGASVPLKQSVDDALALKDAQGNLLGATVQKTIVFRRAGGEVPMKNGRDVWWHQELEQVAAHCPAEPMESEDVLFILYTSGSTGKPKGIFHSTAGYLLGAKLSHQNIFDLQDTDIFWCTADIGWITGHSYVVYGPLANGATIFMYEGAPNFPAKDRYWEMIARRKITIFYTAPTAIRAFMQWGDEWPKKHDLSSLRLLGTVGEPINPQAWIWYHENIGGKHCPIVDTWWQTETGSIMISTFPGAVSAKPGSAGLPLPGIHPEILDDGGNPVPRNAGGKLVIRRPWPSMLRGVWGDPERFAWTYWKDLPGNYLTGDGARQDADGYFWIVGRIDDVLNVSGHRIGTAEVESSLVGHPAVAEAAVVGRPDDIKGFALVVFVTLRAGMQSSPALRDELRKHVGTELGAVAKPDEIRFTQGLPKTRSGKIMRRLLKQVAAGTEVSGDMTTLEDFNVLAQLSEEEE